MEAWELLLSALLVGGGVAVAFSTIPDLRRARQSMRWPSTPGVILDAGFSLEELASYKQVFKAFVYDVRVCSLGWLNRNTSTPAIA